MITRRMKATLLIITLFSVGLGLLLSPLIHDANATCDSCDSYKRVAEALCKAYKEGGAICELAWDYYYLCWVVAHFYGLN